MKKNETLFSVSFNKGFVSHNNNIYIFLIWFGIRNSRRISTQLISKKRIIRMLCVLVLEFFICWTPIYVINVWSLYAPKQVLIPHYLFKKIYFKAPIECIWMLWMLRNSAQSYLSEETKTYNCIYRKKFSFI
jgi:hypothetical protein